MLLFLMYILICVIGGIAFMHIGTRFDDSPVLSPVLSRRTRGVNFNRYLEGEDELKECKKLDKQLTAAKVSVQIG